MANPPNPIGPNLPHRASEPVRPGTDNFKDFMKVGDSDAKQKQKKEEREEAKTKKAADTQTRTSPASRPTTPKGKVPKMGKGVAPAAPTHGHHPAHLAPKHTIPTSSPQKPTYTTQDPKKRKPIPEAAPLPPPPLEPKLREPEILEEEESSTKLKTTTPPKPEQAPQTLPPAATPLGLSFLTPTSSAPPAYSLLGGEMLAFFEKMVSTIMVLSDSSIKETTVHLTGADFAHLANAQIVIREYSSAPLIYNIELIGNPEAVAFFQKNLASLRSAFDERKSRFRVNRLDSALSKEAVRRKKESDT